MRTAYLRAIFPLSVAHFIPREGRHSDAFGCSMTRPFHINICALQAIPARSHLNIRDGSHAPTSSILPEALGDSLQISAVILALRKGDERPVKPKP